MVSAKPAKELQNVLPNGNPFPRRLLYTGYRGNCLDSLALLLRAISRVSLRTLLMWVGVRGISPPHLNIHQRTQSAQKSLSHLLHLLHLLHLPLVPHFVHFATTLG
jgi:hypothetical protein